MNRLPLAISVARLAAAPIIAILILWGDDAFFAGARAWVADHIDSAATTDDLQATMEAASGTDLDAFFDAWVHSADRPHEYPAPS